MVSVPSNYDQYVKEAAAGTGLPYAVVAAQAQAESNFSANVTSSAGAEGWLQFMPGTYNQYTSAAGVKPGSEYDVASETKVYILYMKDLLKQYGGNVRNALAAYNAGPANISAGYGYADSILAAAKQGANTTVPTSGSGSTPASTDSLIPGISVSKLVESAINKILNMMGLGSLTDMLERAGLIILGFALVILGIHLLGQGESAKTYVNNQRGSGSEEEAPEEEEAPAEEEKPAKEAKKTTKAAEEGGTKVGATEAVEAAAVA